MSKARKPEWKTCRSRQLGVESLAEEGFLIEVDAVAVAQ
jgi:hypothetical protein